MLRLYSKACEHAIRMLAVLPADQPQEVFSPGKIARKAKVAESYARKGLQGLSQSGILSAVTGPGGGYRLSRDPRRIRLLEIVEAIEGKDCFQSCVLGLPSCGGKAQCPLHDSWAPLKEKIVATLNKVTLWDLIQVSRH